MSQPDNMSSYLPPTAPIPPVPGAYGVDVGPTPPSAYPNPVTAPPLPMSAAPLSGLPVTAWPAPVPARPRNRLPLVMALIAVVPLALGVVMTVLFTLAQQDKGDLSSQVQSLQGQVSSLRSDAQRSADDLSRAKAQLQQATGDLADQKSQNEKDRATALECVQAASDYSETWLNSYYQTHSAAQATRAAAKVLANGQKVCGEIDIKLGTFPSS